MPDGSLESGISMTTHLGNCWGRVFRFLLRQAREIHKGGLPVLHRKGCPFVRKAFLLVALVLLLPVVVLVRALRPVVVIRFGSLDSQRIGNFAGSTEVYLCQLDAGMHGSRTFDIFYYRTSAGNQQLKKMWDRTLHVSRFARSLDRLTRQLPGGEKHVIPMPSDNDIHGLLPRTRVHLSFTGEEERLGRVALRELGIPAGTPFVCFHARDSAYLDTVLPGIN